MDIVCFCHLRWDFVYQRPQHLLSRAANDYRVILIEEPIEGTSDSYQYIYTKEGVHRIVPCLAANGEDRNKRLKILITKVLSFFKVVRYITWYYSPLFYEYTAHLKPQLMVYDCMDELSAFKFASPMLKKAEEQLMEAADIILTGGHSLYQAKKTLHNNVHCFPSSIDHAHFLKSRTALKEPADQVDIPCPRLGFFGVVDERFDTELLKKSAEQLPGHQFVIIGPVVKIDPADLPRAPNIHYLGAKTYNELPAYISKWDIALVLFARNEATRFISPTKTPEYLCAGKPVISTPIADVIHDFQNNPLVWIARDADSFVQAAREIMQLKNLPSLLSKSDMLLKENSWDITYQKIFTIIQQALRPLENLKKEKVYV